MRATTFLAGLAASAAAESIARDASKLFTLETAPGETVTVTEEEKWEMMDVDIPRQRAHPQVDKSRMQAHLERFSAFHNRYYLSRTGVESAEWLFGQISAIVDAAGHPTANVRYVRHTAWSQPSIIVTIPGQNQRTVVVGAHLDSVISGDRGAGRAPGADDNGSGSVMILEVLRVALTDQRIAAGELLNTVEFHWYGAEEAGLLGSQDIFTQYNASRRQVVAMLNQDMVGYVGRDGVERFGVVTDWVDLDQVAFMKRVIDAYTDIPYEETVCGYACSDHASANRNGYPSSFIFEAPFGNHNPYIHTPNDTIEHVSFDHALQHAKMTTGFVFELAYWPFA
ncbi:hypothetical protein COL922a_009707 [Colletotrichum nupharicola]|nr:hypothetical protein COL922a_009707 [Colletotrichum nupharicola]